MGGILEQRRVFFATAFAIALIGGAYLLARGATTPPIAQASEESALLQAIATRDSDSDGLSDWEEALYGTDPKNADTNDLGMTDGEAVAQGLVIPHAISDVPEAGGPGTVVNPDLPPAPAEGTLTAAFAKNIFTRYLSALESNGGQFSDNDLTDIANQALTELGNSIVAAPPFKSARDLAVSGSGHEAMKAFAVSAEAVMEANTASANKSELAYLKSAVEDNDTAAVGHIASIAKAYRGSAAGIAVLPVPQELATDDFMLVNTLARLSEVVNDLARVNDDPLATMIALQAYPQAVLDMTDALIAVAKSYQAAGITFTAGEPGASFVHIIDDIAAEQAAATKP